jgi:hypothetical protein
MQAKNGLRIMWPVLFIFILSTALFVLFRSVLTTIGVDVKALLAGNIILFIATFFALVLFLRAMHTTSPHVIMRMTYSALGLKLLICAATMLVYVVVKGKDINRGAVFACLGLYCIYTFIEVKMLLRQGRQQKNG